MRAVAPIAGGANNRVFRRRGRGRHVPLKSYFRHPDDPRDRLGTEFAFSRFAWDNGVRCIPQPLACDPRSRPRAVRVRRSAGTLHGTDGRRAARSIRRIDFFRTLNRAKDRPAAAALPRASESCFSLDDHFATVNRRVERLQSIAVGGVVDLAAAAFVETELVPAWRQVLRRAAGRGACGLPLDRPLDAADRCLSPSDFGFHNALLGQRRPAAVHRLRVRRVGRPREADLRLLLPAGRAGAGRAPSTGSPGRRRGTARPRRCTSPGLRCFCRSTG